MAAAVTAHARPGVGPAGEREALAGPGRAGHLPQPRDRLLRAAGQGPRAARAGDRGRRRGRDRRRRVRPGQRHAGSTTARTGCSSRPPSSGPPRRPRSRASRRISAPAWSRASAPSTPGRLVAGVRRGACSTLIEHEPERLREVDGIGPKRAERIVKGWADQKVIREIMLFLHGHGVGTSRAVRIFKTYGADAVQVITENPYRLARDIRGIGFKSADQIAARLGIEKTAMIRARAGISYALAEALDEGHCGLPDRRAARARRRAARDPGRGGRRRPRAGARRGRGGGRHGRAACLRVPGRAAPGRARHRRAPAAPGRRPPALARDRRRQGAGLGRGEDRDRPGRRASGRRCAWRCAPSCW